MFKKELSHTVPGVVSGTDLTMTQWQQQQQIAAQQNSNTLILEILDVGATYLLINTCPDLHATIEGTRLILQVIPTEREREPLIMKDSTITLKTGSGFPVIQTYHLGELVVIRVSINPEPTIPRVSATEFGLYRVRT